MSEKLFTTFDQANAAMPQACRGNVDPLAHTTLDDLAYCAQHELDLYYEGEDNDFKNKRQVEAAKRFFKRCTGQEYK